MLFPMLQNQCNACQYLFPLNDLRFLSSSQEVWTDVTSCVFSAILCVAHLYASEPPSLPACVLIADDIPMSAWNIEWILNPGALVILHDIYCGRQNG